MKSTTLTFITLAFALLIASCQKEAPISQQGFADLRSADGFLFDTHRKINLGIRLQEDWGKEKVRLDIYDVHPAQSAQHLYSEFLNAAGEATGSAFIPSTLNEVYVQLTFPNGSVSGKYLKVEKLLSAFISEPDENGSYIRTDSDLDGVKDPADLYPQNQQASAEVNYPGNGSFATVAFENSWPYHSDFDFNDYVVEYRHILITNANNKVQKIKIVANLIKMDGKLGFAFNLPVSSDLIKSVKGSRADAPATAPNGVERGVSSAVVHLFDGNSEVGQNVELEIVLNEAVDPKVLKGADLNPFVYQLADRGIETHLKGRTPTDKATQQIFGTGDDASNDRATYQDDRGLPWALNVSDRWQLPSEGSDILRSYPKLSRWITSGGTLNQNWYQ